MGQGGILRLIAVHTCRLQGTMRTNNNDTDRFLLYVQQIRHTHLHLSHRNKVARLRKSMANFQIRSSRFCVCVCVLLVLNNLRINLLAGISARFIARDMVVFSFRSQLRIAHILNKD